MIKAAEAIITHGDNITYPSRTSARYVRSIMKKLVEEVMTDNTFDILAAVVATTRCKPGWTFWLADENGAKRLVIQIKGVNNYDHTEPYTVNHYHPVPITTYNEKSWRRWIFEQCIRTMNHELGESLRFISADGEVRPFVPMHGPGEDPYTVHEWRSESDALTIQDGSLREGPV